MHHSLKAWITYEGQTLLAEMDTLDENSTETPVIRLIDALYTMQFNQPRLWARQKIFHNYALTERCIQTIKIAAKRAEFKVDYISFSQKAPSLKKAPNPFSKVNFPISFQEIYPENASAILSSILDEYFFEEDTWKVTEKRLRPRPIVSILADRDGKFLKTSCNQSHLCSTWHAEVLLVREFGKFPKGAQVYTSLEPCKMCVSHLLWAAPDDSRFRVYALEKELGPSARGSALVKAGILKIL